MAAAGARPNGIAGNPLRLESFFLSDTVGHGVIHDRFDRLIGEATAEMSGYWRGNVFLLDEGRGNRITAPEMVGEGRGSASGNRLVLVYRLRRPVGGGR